jgi:hypothetical protein
LYGLDDRSNFVQRIVERIEASRSGIITRADDGDAAFIRLRQEGHADEMQRTVDFVRTNEGLLSEALRS